MLYAALEEYNCCVESVKLFDNLGKAFYHRWTELVHHYGSWEKYEEYADNSDAELEILIFEVPEVK